MSRIATQCASLALGLGFVLAGCAEAGQSDLALAYARDAGTLARAEIDIAEVLPVCGGPIARGCADGQFCDFPESSDCGSGTRLGTCAEIPESCPLDFDFVCGCDGKTYGSRCAAAAIGVSVRTRGPCK